MQVEGYAALPRLELDAAQMFPPWSVLREQARPVFRVRVELRAADAVDSADAVGWHHRPYGGLALGHDLRVCVAGRDPEPEHAPPRLTDAPVAEVLTQQIGVGGLVHIGGDIARTIATPPLRIAVIAHR